MKTIKKFLCTLLAVVMCLSSALFIGLDFTAEAVGYEVGDTIQFGSYPQSKVEDEGLIAELNKLAPEWEKWTSYGYYSGNGQYGSMVQGDWMRYIDVTYNGEKYRAVKFTQYRPEYVLYSVPYSNLQYANGYYKNICYWFKFEPVDWRILDPLSGLILCETVIDSQPFSNTVYYNSKGYYLQYNDALLENYASDYETSSIRKWLNNDFYNTAFSDREKNEISYTTINNESYSNDDLDSKPTTDKVFLLSINDVINSAYGFNTVLLTEDTSRKAIGSDYAGSQGLWIYDNNSGYASWILRTPGYISSRCGGVARDGSVCDNYDVNMAEHGVRPALILNDIYSYNHSHLYNAIVTAPTCTAQGFTTYTCSCKDSYVADYVNALGHKDADGDYKCDNGCGYEYEKPAPEEEPCDCNCHAGGIKAFFFKLINFFKKIFDKSAKVCKCGAAH